MNILCLLGSGRKKGNSRTMADAFTRRAEGLGATVTTHDLTRMKYQGCIGCWGCKKGEERCVVDDDLLPVLDQARKADCWVLATPVYFGEVAAQIKGFIDRTFSFLYPDYYMRDKKEVSLANLEPGKKLVFCIAQGAGDPEAFADIFPRYDRFYQWMNFQPGILVRGVGVYFEGDAAKHPDLLEEATRAAETVCSGGSE